MAKIGRNDPCPCGSGKRHKSCCLQVSKFEPPAAVAGDADWLKIRRTEGELIPAILDFGFKTYGKYLLDEAFDEFYIHGEFDPEEIDFENFFFPWFIFNWHPEGSGIDPALSIPHGQLGLAYLETNQTHLNSYQKAFIHAACDEPFCFFSVTEVVPGKSLILRDVFLDRTFTVKEATGSRTLRPGDAIFARVVSLEEQAILVGIAPIVLPPKSLPYLFDAREDMKKRMRKLGLGLNLEVVHRADFQMRGLYLGLAQMACNPPRPELANTDGDPLNFVTHFFELACSPQEAFDELKALTLPEFEDQVLEDALYDARGELLKATFSWHRRGNKTQKHWSQTILGTINIDGNRLTAEVNSERRAKRIRSDVEKMLGKRVIYKRSLYVSTEQKLAEMQSQPSTRSSMRDLEELNSRPEVQALLAEHAKAQWEAWYNQRIPALQNKTPMQASRTKAGRERLEALLFDFERRNELLEPFLRVDVNAIRKRLAL